MNYPVTKTQSAGDALTRRSAAFQAEPLRVSVLRTAAAIAGPSPAFVSLTRNPSLEPPARFEPTTKAPEDVVI